MVSINNVEINAQARVITITNIISHKLSVVFQSKRKEVMAHIIDKSDLKPGDILLCFTSSGDLNNKVQGVTGSGYSHAAICINGDVVGEALRGGVRKTKIEDILDEYEYVALLRQPDCWNATRLKKLESFVDQAINDRVAFNFEGIKNFVDANKESRITEIQRITDYFEGKSDPVVPEKGQYFCSELVAAVFIHVGIIEQSAATVYSLEVTSPADLRDPTYGSFVGYLVICKKFEIPSDDEFFNETPFHEIWAA